MNIQDIKANLPYGGARASHFHVVITNPINPTADIKIPFLCKAASLPASTIGKIEIPYFGRKWPVPGDRTYEDWTTTIMNDEDFAIKDSIEAWHSAINAPQRNVQSQRNISLYMSQATITQKAKDDTTLRVYQFNDIWPLTVSSIDTSWETTDAIEEFQVTWAFREFHVNGGITGNGGGF